MRAAQRLDESWNFSYVNRGDIPLTAETRMTARKIGLLGVAALAFRLNPEILSRVGRASPMAVPSATLHHLQIAASAGGGR
jgi:hypothetical protein